MGVDIYLPSVWEPFFEKFEGSAAHHIARSHDDPASAIYDAYRESGGYFRNAYNGTDVMAALGSSWNAVYAMCDAEQRLPVERARELVAMIEARPFTRELYAHHLLHHGYGPIQEMMNNIVAEATGEVTPPPDVDLFFPYVAAKREQLLAILRKSIALNEPLLVS
jgi:hypothetical protein